MAMLRTFGLAKCSMEQSICEESRHLQEAMEKEKGLQNNRENTQLNSVLKHNKDIPSVQMSHLTLCRF